LVSAAAVAGAAAILLDFISVDQVADLVVADGHPVLGQLHISRLIPVHDAHLLSAR
jgi:hypothetical protein